MIIIKGKITPQTLANFRVLYLYGNAPLRVFFFGLGLAMLWLLATMVLKQDPTMPAWSYACAVSFALLSFSASFFLHQLWWRWWLRAYQAEVAPDLDGALAEDGFHLLDGLTPWSQIVGAKSDPRSILLYIIKYYVHPIHRSMVHSDEAWREATALVRRHVPRWRTLLSIGSA